jgi:hypothetical protein
LLFLFVNSFVFVNCVVPVVNCVFVVFFIVNFVVLVC